MDIYKRTVDDLADLLGSTKQELDAAEKRFDDVPRAKEYLLARQKSLFPRMDDFWAQLWKEQQEMRPEEHEECQKYLRRTIHPLAKENIEVNERIYDKPFGYPGDFVVMNYIYDHHTGKMFGKTLYEMLINSYTCGLPISRSNVVRKEFYKNKISEVDSKRRSSRVMSVGGGSLRELTELISAEKLDGMVNFTSIDFEKRAIEYVKNKMSSFPNDLADRLSLDFIYMDVRDIIRRKELGAGEQDLIYAAGIFDYLGERISRRLLKNLFEDLKPGGELYLCNISDKNTHRAYYETLGDWIMFHRNVDILRNWTEDLRGIAGIEYPAPENGDGYVYMKLTKNAD